MDALLAALERDASAEAAKLGAEGEQRAQELLTRAEAEAAQRRAKTLGRLAEVGRRSVACETAAAARRYREARLQQRAELLDRIFAEAERYLRVASIDRYQEQLPTLVRTTFQFLEGGPAVLHCRPELAARVELLRGDRADLTVHADPEAAAGILGESGDGAVVVDNTLAALLRRQQADLAVAVAARIEAE
jgi:vacuolar-type H+-ATPase subunit E/Vma4